MQPTASVDRLQGRRPSCLSNLSHSLRMRRSLSVRELAVALMSLSLIAVVVFAPHLRHGGFYLDDWSNAAAALNPPGSPDVGSALSSFAEFTLYRPVLVLYVPLTYFVFGMHMHYHLAWALVLAVLAGTLFYGVLRTLGVPWIHAWLITALAIMFPWSDSTRLWATADQVTLSILFAVTGLLVALTCLKQRSGRWHIGAAAFYLLSILTYEVTLPLIVCFGAIYCFQVGWRAARARWLADVGVALVAGAWVGANTTRTASGLGGDLEHLKQIIERGGTIVGRAGFPLGSPQTTFVLIAMAVILCVGIVAYFSFRDRFTDAPWGLRQWLLLAGAGLAVTALGWAAFIPADPYYTPTIYGETNRVNGLAGFGLVLFLYGQFGILGSLVGQMRPRAGWVAAGVTALLAALMLVAYVNVLRRHMGIWDEAFAAERSALLKLKNELPRLPHRTTVIVSSYPANQAVGVPIMTTMWDFDGMVKMEYDDDSLHGYPLLQELVIGCRVNGVTLERNGDVEVPTAKYGTVRLVDLEKGLHSAPRSQSECRGVVDSYVPGPMYLSTPY